MRIRVLIEDLGGVCAYAGPGVRVLVYFSFLPQRQHFALFIPQIVARSFCVSNSDCSPSLRQLPQMMSQASPTWNKNHSSFSSAIVFIARFLNLGDPSETSPSKESIPQHRRVIWLVAMMMLTQFAI